MDAAERDMLDHRLALIGVLQELTVATLDLFDPSSSTDDLLRTIATRLGCAVALCVEADAEPTRPLILRGSAGLARASRTLPLPGLPPDPQLAALPLPYPETRRAPLVRWVIGPFGDTFHGGAPPAWLLLYFEREPRSPQQYRGMLERLSQHLGVAFAHRRLYATLERRVEERTQELAGANRELARSLVTLRETQHQLLQAGKLAAVGQLAAGVAHEINNPLAVILGFSHALERRVAEGEPLRLPVVSIVREALRCKGLVQELLAFSRLPRRAVEEVELNELLGATGQLLESRANSQGTRLRLELDASLRSVRANRAQLQQLVINLGNNALDAVQGGGEVILRSRPGEASEVRVEVQDSGPGIPEKIRERIFEPFFTTKEVGRGTGLGLSIAWEIASQHQGSLEVETEVGAGTTMILRLPAQPARGGAALVSSTDPACPAGGA